jgi:hypothetical protein
LIGANKNLSAVSGTGNFDFSASSGTFLTSTGAVTIGPGAVGVSGITTFSASGTAVVITNSASVGGALVVTGEISANGGIGRSSAGTLSIGVDAETTGLNIGTGAASGAVALGTATGITSITLGRTGVTTTIAGDLQVNGAETISGTSTFTSDATFNGNVTFGDAATDTVEFLAGIGSVTNPNFIFVKELNHIIKVGASTSATTAGGNLSLLSGNGNSAAGGNLTIDAGTGSTGGVLSLGASQAESITLGRTSKAISVAGLLATTGSGNINLPNNGTSRFQIEGVSVGATVTAANLNTLTNTSNADALHTHSGLGVSYITGVAGETISIGQPVAFQDASGVAKVFRADADGSGQLPNVVGIAATAASSGGAVSVQTSQDQSIPDARWDAIPATSDVGKRVYLSENVGNLTLTAPSTAGSTVLKIGIVTVGGTGAVKIAVQIGEGTVL